MNAKITLVELSELMAASTSTSRKVCELFLRELFATISQALIQGETVKVKGIGTFKITAVKPRKSVNVVTGEDIQLNSHNKLTFTPDKSLAAAVNQAFDQFEAVFLDDAVTEEKLAEIDQQYPSIFKNGDEEGKEVAETPKSEPVAPVQPEEEQPAPVQEVEPAPEPVVAPEPAPAPIEPKPEPVPACGACTRTCGARTRTSGTRTRTCGACTRTSGTRTCGAYSQTSGSPGNGATCRSSRCRYSGGRCPTGC